LTLFLETASMAQVSDHAGLVRGAVDSFNAGDYAGFSQLFSPDVVLVADPQVAHRATYTGRAGIHEWVDEARSRWVGVRFSALSVEAVGAASLVELGVMAETEAGGGAWRLYVLLWWGGDQIVRLRSYPSRDSARADAGEAA
jgi:hypothetical protein